MYGDYEKEEHGELEIYRPKKTWSQEGIGLVCAGLVVAGILLPFRFHPPQKNSIIEEAQTPSSTSSVAECYRRADGVYDCSDPFAKEKAQAVTKWYVYQETITASITKYSPVESCHYPKWQERRRSCLTASGSPARYSHTMACPYNIRFGVSIRTPFSTYWCEDRTAKWVQAKYGPTFDIFVEDQKEAIRFGRQRQEVTITHKIPRVEYVSSLREE